MGLSRTCPRLSLFLQDGGLQGTAPRVFLPVLLSPFAAPVPHPCHRGWGRSVGSDPSPKTKHGRKASHRAPHSGRLFLEDGFQEVGLALGQLHGREG